VTDALHIPIPTLLRLALPLVLPCMDIRLTPAKCNPGRHVRGKWNGEDGTGRMGK
jgi:hypothetical protein